MAPPWWPVNGEDDDDGCAFSLLVTFVVSLKFECLMIYFLKLFFDDERVSEAFDVYC